ncbi:Maf family nucleotide pyrophosphatase [Geofilum rhodophaeum]|uniref:Maf family nucleotide pyrophosphatase n=1 Tax=Geofilum rhodophaeum TaxID=1965019 RepID=UPI000B528DD0|nr:Maf family nucleotide pyrophosphatase [Geofilum rhodophaeum]
MLDNIKDYRIVLASGSPRRSELLKMAHINFEVLVVPDLPETYPDDLALDQIPEYLARQKQAAYASEWGRPDTLVLTADTIVELDGKVLNKPVDREDALRMLGALSGNKHRVLTGVVIKSAQKEVAFTAVTEVWFKSLKKDVLSYYVDQCKPFDKAGAYGVQEWIGLVGVERIEGSFYNVMGLPVGRLYEELSRF